jgi:hypothetical protein
MSIKGFSKLGIGKRRGIATAQNLTVMGKAKRQNNNET